MQERRCLNCMTPLQQTETECPVCGQEYGSAKNPPFSLQPGSVLDDKYLVGTILHIDSTEITYNGFDQQRGQNVIIHELLPSLHQETQKLEAPGSFVRQGMAYTITVAAPFCEKQHEIAESPRSPKFSPAKFGLSLLLLLLPFPARIEVFSLCWGFLFFCKIKNLCKNLCRSGGNSTSEAPRLPKFNPTKLGFTSLILLLPDTVLVAVFLGYWGYRIFCIIKDLRRSGGNSRDFSGRCGLLRESGNVGTPLITEKKENIAIVKEQQSLYSSPSIGGRILTTLAAGEEVEVSRIEPIGTVEWAYVKSEPLNVMGWIVTSKLDISNVKLSSVGSSTKT